MGKPEYQLAQDTQKLFYTYMECMDRVLSWPMEETQPKSCKDKDKWEATSLGAWKWNPNSFPTRVGVSTNRKANYTDIGHDVTWLSLVAAKIFTYIYASCCCTYVYPHRPTQAGNQELVSKCKSRSLLYLESCCEPIKFMMGLGEVLRTPHKIPLHTYIHIQGCAYPHAS